jgi:hypothetical protein
MTSADTPAQKCHTHLYCDLLSRTVPHRPASYDDRSNLRLLDEAPQAFLVAGVHEAKVVGGHLKLPHVLLCQRALLHPTQNLNKLHRRSASRPAPDAPRPAQSAAAKAASGRCGALAGRTPRGRVRTSRVTSTMLMPFWSARAVRPARWRYWSSALFLVLIHAKPPRSFCSFTSSICARRAAP